MVRTREPGGSPGAEDIRALVVSGAAERWSARTELLLMYASRSDHLERTIVPALDAGQWVVCDRFADSSRVYQGLAGGVDLDLVSAIEHGVVGDHQPDLTLVFDLPFEVGLERAMGRSAAETRFESKGAAFHARLRDGFRAVAEANPHRCRLIDASGELDAVTARVWAAVEPLL